MCLVSLVLNKEDFRKHAWAKVATGRSAKTNSLAAAETSDFVDCESFMAGCGGDVTCNPGYGCQDGLMVLPPWFPTTRIYDDDITAQTCLAPYKPTSTRMEHDSVDPPPKMNPSNVEQHNVDYILQFISPPSNLQAVPIHALSRALMQRHHFLGISPDTPHEYLSWPSNDEGKAGQEAIDLLEQYYAYAEHHPYRTVYTSDGDYTYGHVALSCSGLSKGIRLVFQWDFSSESWKFHDLKTMPFPEGAKSSPLVVSPFSTQVMSTPVLVTGGGSPTSEEDDNDAYWNAYGTDRPYGGPASASIRDPGSEDAYWAQYSAIQGS